MDLALQQRDEVDHNTELTHAKSDTRPAAAAAAANQDDNDHRETTPKMLAHDSMVTVRLSEPPTLTLDTNVGPDSPPRRRPSTVKIEKLPFPTETLEAKAQDQPEDETDDTPPSDPTTPLPVTTATRNLQDELVDCEDEAEEEGDRITSLPARGTLLETPIEFKRPVVDEEGEEEDEEEVNWDELQKSEAQEPRDADTDRSTAMLLAMLEQENDKLATNPKTIKVQAVEQVAASNRPRPPSMAQLRHMVHGPTPPALRYSMLPPPPMTDLEFYAALVKDYQQTAARLPTLLSNKIRKGIPPPLRGVVWQSMAGARDSALEEQYERFTGESSPYEPIIGKDLGRSFPGVDMFRDPEGDGQRMLGRVLKCFNLSGLHVRIYQFRELLREHMTPVSNHLEELQVDPAYVSQWFLSFFAVTCPLPMLFRIYDVIFAEGAPETLMRVALSLMQKNQARILACTELEDVMQLLLSRGLWDCYHYNADEFVQDFVSLSGVVTRETLLQLEQGYRDAQIASANAARSSDVTTAASRFLGRIWASSTIISPKSSSTLSPGLTAPSRPLSMLRRSTSKQSLASTLNSMEASSVSVLSSASTEATTVSRDSSNTDSASIRESTPISSGGKAFNGGKNNKENALHTQIEDLLTALTELQRNHASLANELQKEREQREDDKQAVRSLLDGLRKKASNDSVGTDASVDTLKAIDDPANEAREGGEGDVSTAKTGEQDTPSPGDLSQLLDNVEERFGRHGSGSVERRMSRGESKSEMQQELQQLKDQLASAVSQSQDYNRKMHDLEQEITTLKDQVRESHSHTRILHQDKQRLEKQIHTMRARASAAGAESNTQPDGDSPVRKSSASGASGLRELKLGRSKSTPSQAGSIFSKRSSSMPKPHDSTPPLAIQAPPPVPAPPPTDDQHEALLLELVQAKTSEAIARQEAEETKQKLESLRKAYSLVTGEASQSQPAATAAGTAASAAMGVFGRLTGAAVEPAKPATPTPAPAAAAAAPTPAVGGFWGWRR
ncbi:uncharacterized protein N0V96_006896 [Colletotrichum fioriniae]|uniref:uncharacterized protein n=1 Tax=Colletotrichum fioriniae TaxID=710243 RepID=UPI0032DB62B2|nr:hypothetical protein N0V96_006896 [Colletotrichum fioriniae]